jgi:hypothetical protein
VSIDHVSDFRREMEEGEGTSGPGSAAALPSFGTKISADGGCGVFHGFYHSLLICEIEGIVILPVGAARITLRLDHLRVNSLAAALAAHGELFVLSRTRSVWDFEGRLVRARVLTTRGRLCCCRRKVVVGDREGEFYTIPGCESVQGKARDQGFRSFVGVNGKYEGTLLGASLKK